MNDTIANRLQAYAAYLDGDEGNVHRTRAYRRAAETLRALPQPVEQLLKEGGPQAVRSLPGIGKSIAYTIENLVHTGEFRTLRPDGAHIDPERQLRSLPGVGPRLAELLVRKLGITDLEGLELAAHEGRLAEVGVGHKRLRGLMDALSCRLRRGRATEPADEPDIELLLACDAEYRERVADNRVVKVSPRRFNPEGAAWLPVHRMQKEDWVVVALFSNTALAHRLGQTRDWVILRFEKGPTSGQRTVVTETRGDLRGLRVVRGREDECRAHYAEHPSVPGPEPAA